jgi:hypothetical protein
LFASSCFKRRAARRAGQSSRRGLFLFLFLIFYFLFSIFHNFPFVIGHLPFAIVHLSLVIGHWSLVIGPDDWKPITMKNDNWKMENGKWKIVKLKIENGK